VTPAERDAIRETITTLTDRVLAAERRATKAEAERDVLRALLARVRTSLAETTTLDELSR